MLFIRRFNKRKAGAYVFADDLFDVKYIGKAAVGRMVVERDKDSIEDSFEVHSARYRQKDFGATQVPKHSILSVTEKQNI